MKRHLVLALPDGRRPLSLSTSAWARLLRRLLASPEESRGLWNRAALAKLATPLAGADVGVFVAPPR